MQPPAIPTLLMLIVLACTLTPLHVGWGGGLGGEHRNKINVQSLLLVSFAGGFNFFFFISLSLLFFSLKNSTRGRGTTARRTSGEARGERKSRAAYGRDFPRTFWEVASWPLETWTFAMQVIILPDCIKESDKDFMNLSFIGCKMLLFIFLKLFYTFWHTIVDFVYVAASTRCVWMEKLLLLDRLCLRNGQRHRCRCKSFSRERQIVFFFIIIIQFA